MQKLSKTAAGVGLSAALLLSSTVTVAASTITVSGNGADSENSTKVTVERKINIAQSNTADINNNIDASARTGNNSIEDTTGGDSVIDTGDATTTVALSNKANTSKATVACCEDEGFSVKVSGNGADSKNKVDLRFENTINILDEKYLNIDNNVNATADTGNNWAFGNLGNVLIRTGDAKVNVGIDNKGNENTIIIGSVLPNPETPEEPGKPGKPGKPKPGLPKPGSVLGEHNGLPVTGFNLQVLALISAGLIGAGLLMRFGSSEAVADFAARFNQIRTRI